MTIEQEAEEYANSYPISSTAEGGEAYRTGLRDGYLVKGHISEKEILQAQIDVLDSLFDLGLKDVRQTLKTPVEIYNDVINPLKKELYKQLKELE